MPTTTHLPIQTPATVGAWCAALLQWQPEYVSDVGRQLGFQQPRDAATRALLRRLRALPVYDATVKQARDLEQRQTLQNYWPTFVTTLGGAILGWPVSLLGTPATVLRLVGR